MKMRIDFGDFVTDCVRILVLLNSVTMRKSIKLTESKIKLYDFYFKFPNTMIEETELSRSEKNFDEYYAFFHWKPAIKFFSCRSSDTSCRLKQIDIKTNLN